MRAVPDGETPERVVRRWNVEIWLRVVAVLFLPDLMRAQAYGDEAALINAGRRVVRVSLT